MDTMRPLGGAAVLLIAVGLGGITASLVTNDLFTGETVYAAPVIATAVVFVIAIVTFIAVGRPWKFWKRTPYW
jgi:hypothetical protein